MEPGTSKDTHEIRELAAATLAERYAPEWIDQHMGSLLVARDVGLDEVVGFIIMQREEPCLGHIVALAVDKAHQGRGIGSALLREAGNQLVFAGARELTLEVRADDPRAQAFYARHGFQPSGLQTSVYRDGEDAVRLTRPI